MTTIKAIETVYNGYRFRSRLEARWAVFFDAMNINYKYENEGFEDSGVKWLPDFYLPDSKTYVEVKGSNSLLHADADKLDWMLDYGNTPETHSSNDDPEGPGLRGCLLLGDIPAPATFVYHPIIQHHEGLYLRYVRFEPFFPCLFNYRQTGSIESVMIPKRKPISTIAKVSLEPIRLFISASENGNYLSEKMVREAYIAARQARFEHGENGRRS